MARLPRITVGNPARYCLAGAEDPPEADEQDRHPERDEHDRRVEDDVDDQCHPSALPHVRIEFSVTAPAGRLVGLPGRGGRGAVRQAHALPPTPELAALAGVDLANRFAGRFGPG